ncbi:MAG: hypothetical protein JRJ84_13050 [Deltaproteobacteria bacterium]|nr:hypothetical protein [Deltaproteobacteria bacterium]
MNRAFLFGGGAPAAGVLLAGAVAVAVVVGVAALWRADLVVDGRTWWRWVALAFPAAGPLLIPAATGFAGVAVLARWRAEGSWTGLRGCGIAGRNLLPAVVAWGILGAVGTGCMTHFGEPWARREAQAAVEAPWLRVGLWPGRTTRLGPLSVRPGRVADGWAEDVLFTVGDQVGFAGRMRLVRVGDGAAVELRDGVLVGPVDHPWRLSWSTWVRALPAHQPRVQLNQRRTSDLRAAAARTEAAGGAAGYEWAVYFKRWLHPVAALLLPWALLPLGAGRRPTLAAALCGVGYLLVVRAGDHVAEVVGGLPAAAAGPCFVVVLGLVTWARWRDR